MITFNDLKALLESNRSYRRFDSTRPIGMETLLSLVELTRYCASGRNLQPLRYRIVNSESECQGLFPHLKWAGYYTDWNGPADNERPVAYLVQCIDTAITSNCLCDDGLELEAITLGATALGIGGVIIKSFNASAVARVLAIPERYKPLYVLPLGYPAEVVALKDTDGSADADIRYYHDADGRHIVPKRLLKERLIEPDNQ